MTDALYVLKQNVFIMNRDYFLQILVRNYPLSLFQLSLITPTAEDSCVAINIWTTDKLENMQHILTAFAFSSARSGFGCERQDFTNSLDVVFLLSLFMCCWTFIKWMSELHSLQYLHLIPPLKMFPSPLNVRHTFFFIKHLSILIISGTQEYFMLLLPLTISGCDPLWLFFLNVFGGCFSRYREIEFHSSVIL